MPKPGQEADCGDRDASESKAKQEEIQKAKLAALQSCEPDANGDQFPLSQHIVSVVQQLCQKDIEQQADEQAAEMAFDAQLGMATSQSHASDLLDINACCSSTRR